MWFTIFDPAFFSDFCVQMASFHTKQKILDNAVACFNRDGIANIRLQHIADEANMSIGNMTYHFRTKDLIAEAVWEQIVRKQRDLLHEFRVLPLFEDVERLLTSTFQLQQEYRFFYLDTLEIMRAFPDIQSAHRQHIHWQIQQMELAIRFNQARGAFSNDPAEGHITLLAQQFWMITDLWMYRQNVQNRPPDDFHAFREVVWALFRPYFTDMGLREFEQLNALNLEKTF